MDRGNSIAALLGKYFEREIFFHRKRRITVHEYINHYQEKLWIKADYIMNIKC